MDNNEPRTTGGKLFRAMLPVNTTVSTTITPVLVIPICHVTGNGELCRGGTVGANNMTTVKDHDFVLNYNRGVLDPEMHKTSISMSENKDWVVENRILEVDHWVHDEDSSPQTNQS